MNTPLISVIVPVYNVAPLLPRCIDSILAQTYENLEIILVDDGSTDESGEICEQYAARDGRIRVIHQENAGLSGARNSGIDAMSGEWFGLVDSDDYIDTKMYEEMLAAAIRNNTLLAICGVEKRFLNGKTVNQSYPQLPQVMTGVDAIKYNYKPGIILDYAWIKLYNRKLVEGVGKLRFDTACLVYEDILFTTQILLRADKLAYVPKPYYIYIKRENSLVTSKLNEKKTTALIAYDKVIAIFEENKMPAAIMREIKARYTRKAFRLLSKVPTLDDAAERKRFAARLRKAAWKYIVNYAVFGKVSIRQKISHLKLLLTVR